MNRYLHVGVKGCAAWPKEEQKIKFGGHELILKPATRDNGQSIHINLKGIPDANALTLINRFLSILSWCEDQGMENLYGGAGNPVPAAVPKQTRMIGSSIVFPFYRNAETNEKAQLALALFREGLTVNSAPFQFLSYFKILNIFWEDKHKNGKNEVIEGIKKLLPLLKDDLAIKRIKEIKKTGNGVADYLYKSGRCAVAHAYSKPIVDPDDINDLHRLSQDIWVIKEIAEILIEQKLNISRSIIE